MRSGPVFFLDPDREAAAVDTSNRNNSSGLREPGLTLDAR